MRIADRILTNTTLNNITKSLNSLNNYGTQASSGKKIQTPSEDPIISSRALRYRTIVSETEQYLENVSQANAWVQVTESTLKNVNSIVQNMREICVEGANDTYTIQDRQKLMTEFSSLLEQLETELNTTYMGRHIFSGYFTDSSPIIKDKDGKNVLNPDVYGTIVDPNTVTDPTNPNYDANKITKDIIAGQNINVAVGSSTNVSINTLVTSIYDISDYKALHSMDELFASIDKVLNPDAGNNGGAAGGGAAGGGAAGGADPDKDKAEALKKLSNDLRDAFSGMISTLDGYMSKVSTEHTKIGVKLNKLELVESRLTDDKINYQALKSENEDIDLAQVSINYNAASAAYSAALKIGMSVNQLTLADYL